MCQYMARKALTQPQILQDQSRPKPTQIESDPQLFEGNGSDDLEFWIFCTEQYYSEFQNEVQHVASSSFSEIVLQKLGVFAQEWFHDV
ncbi:hypothetical protein PHMEG_0007936 [Phytophthora megakarya]|uniref:Uncharacterized protein n=1 Tax=Phytophthora megakarya TaxID=4795 RepID=A0A225WJX3_9STRA|nr:hypothetical protein PHMEG_0007936 [Phytophthora megakarya]